MLEPAPNIGDDVSAYSGPAESDSLNSYAKNVAESALSPAEQARLEQSEMAMAERIVTPSGSNALYLRITGREVRHELEALLPAHLRSDSNIKRVGTAVIRSIYRRWKVIDKETIGEILETISTIIAEEIKGLKIPDFAIKS